MLKHNARLVVKGYEQTKGVNYSETFAPVINRECLRVMFAVAVAGNLKSKEIDFKSAFLNGEIDCEAFMETEQGTLWTKTKSQTVKQHHSQISEGNWVQSECIRSRSFCF